MPGRTLEPSDIDAATAQAMLELVNGDRPLDTLVDEPTGRSDDGLVERLQGRLAADGPFGSLDELATTAAREDELEHLALAATAGPMTRLRRRGDVANRQVGLDLVLFDPASGQVHVLNPSGAAIWHHLTPDRSLRAVVDALVLSLGDTSDRSIALDVIGFLTRLGELRLVLDQDAPLPEVTAASPETVTIPDHEISRLEGGYVAPEVRTFDLAELEAQLDSEVAAYAMVTFKDVWMMPVPDTWASTPRLEPTIQLDTRFRTDPPFGTTSTR